MTDRLLSIREAADATGESPLTIRRWVHKGAIASERVGPFKRVRIRLSVLRQFYPDDIITPKEQE